MKFESPEIEIIEVSSVCLSSQTGVSQGGADKDTGWGELI